MRGWCMAPRLLSSVASVSASDSCWRSAAAAMDGGVSSCLTVRESVSTTSVGDGLRALGGAGAKMVAKASSLTALGRLCVMEMGRCCEKKLDRARTKCEEREES